MVDTALHGSRLVIATIAVAVGTLLITLDQFIANVSIPTISGELGVSQDDGSWVITSYTVGNAITVPLTGWLSQRFGRVRVFALSAIFFSIMSFLCGLAWSFPALIAFRALQGLVSGSLIPLSQTLLMQIFPDEKRGLAIGFWGLVIMIGPVMGPVLGGWITQDYGWPWIFYINVPLGILAGIVTYNVLHQQENKTQKLPIDLLGLTLLFLWVAAFQITLDRGQDLDWWKSNVIVALSIIAIVSFAFFSHLGTFPS